jgi:uncharacterized protein YndB with AHSA1/START domain
MGGTVTMADEGTLVAEIEVAATPDRVFEALTKSDQLVQWFTDASCPVKFWKMDARKGGAYSYATEKGTLEVNGISEFECHGEITEYDPPRLLAYTWIASWHLDKQHATLVRWELTPTPIGTRVKVTHSGLAHELAAREDYRGGWVGVVQKLKEFVE